MAASAAILFLGLFVLGPGCTGIVSEDKQPEQVHIAYGESRSEMFVVWNTESDTETTVEYKPSGSSGNPVTAQGVSRTFTDGGENQRVQYVHRVKLTGLSPGHKYDYRVGGSEGWSRWFNFTAMPEGTDWAPRLLLYGDLGLTNARSLPRMINDTKRGLYDAVLHIGDLAYDMHDQDAKVGDQFMKNIEPIAANIPYMTCPGNHENKYNFTNYRNRFVMPGDELGDMMFYSFNMGPVHFISLNTEYYYFVEYGFMQPKVQFDWLEKDLQEAALPANRAQRPWIVTMGHRPMYCSNDDGDDCTLKYSLIRSGWPVVKLFALEPLFYKYGVDLQLWAHEHSYERLWPTYERKVFNGSKDNPYKDPNAPVHIITGSPGCNENHDPFIKKTESWSAFRSIDYGYTRMTVHNKTHLYIEQVSDDKDGAIIDSIMLIKNNHGPYLT